MAKSITYESLMQAYEKASNAYHKTKLGTKANTEAGKRMDKAAQALEAWRINEKINQGEAVSVYESLFV